MRLAEGYSLLDRTAANAAEHEVRAVHLTLFREFDGWRQQAIADSRADLVEIAVEEQTQIVTTLRDMLPRAALFDEMRAEHEPPATPVLQSDIDHPPSVMPRLNLRALRRSIERYHRLVEFEGPEIILCNEASITAQALRWDWEIRPRELYFDAEVGFLETFWLGLTNCVVNGRNIALRQPLSSKEEFVLEEEQVRWIGDGRPAEHPWCEHPDLPMGTFGTGTTAITHYELTSPIHWAAGTELHRLADSAQDKDWAMELRRLAAAGQAVLSWVELMHPDDEERGLMLVDPHMD